MADYSMATRLITALVLSTVPVTAYAQDAGQDPAPAAAPEQPQQVELSAAQLFEYADAARDRGDYATAEAAYQALTNDPDADLRTEARFRLALMYMDQMKRPRDAAVLLRRILDDKPDAARVRVELARVQVALGNLGDAQRELRAAEAACRRCPLYRSATQVVPDVHAFPGHIACDSRSASEIVVPVLDRAGRLIAVFDVDSAAPAAFDEIDKAGLEAILGQVFAG